MISDSGSAHDHVPRVLLVDDDYGVREALGGQLACEGYEVTVAPDGRAALEALRQSHYPVIISDQHMPGMTGLELFTHARELQPHATRILISGVSSLPVLSKAISNGEIYRFLAKPWSLPELLETVKNGVTRHAELKANGQ